MSIWIGLSLLLVSIGGLFAQRSMFCDNVTIDAITYMPDSNQYFIAIAGYYWFLPHNSFPPKSSERQSFEKPFDKPLAAIYVNTYEWNKVNCNSQLMRKGISAGDPQIWVFQMVGGKNQMWAFDPTYKQFAKSGPISITDDKCIGNAKIDSQKPIDAIFHLENHLHIFIVQNESYSMVDCNFICDESIGSSGQGKNPFQIKDLLGTSEEIDAISAKDQTLDIFQKSRYFSIEVYYDDMGELKQKRKGALKDTQTDFLKVGPDLNCNDSDTSSSTSSEKGSHKESTVPTDNIVIETTNGTDKPDQINDSSKESGSKLWLIVIIVIVVIVVGIALCFIFGLSFCSKKSDKSIASVGIEKGYSSKSPRAHTKLPGSKKASRIESELLSKEEKSTAKAVKSSTNKK